MNENLFEKIESINNSAIFDSFAKAVNVIHNSSSGLCSISGGSDSDIVLDIIHNVDENGKITCYWVDTGLEYQATREHLKFLENKYNIKILHIKAVKPIPTCVKEYGVPFISKYVSEQMMRLQKHNFQWEDEPLEILMEKYPNCKTALQWWCNAYYTAENGVQKMSRFAVSRNSFLKEFIMQNPPDFPISNKCCEYAKKKPAKLLIKETGADLEITGIRKAEGGVRSANYKTCFSESKSKNCNTYRPIFYYTDSDKYCYEKNFDIQHSKCYTEYKMKRTGCVGCPFNPRIFSELEIIRENEPKLYTAAVSVFGRSYEYTKKYHEFRDMMKRKQ